MTRDEAKALGQRDLPTLDWGDGFDDGWAAREASDYAKGFNDGLEFFSVPNLQPVIDWLEAGCDPLQAAKELRIYQARRDS